MNFFTLKFRDPTLETQYLTDMFPQSLKKMVFCMILGDILMFFFQILILFWGVTWGAYILLPIQIIFILVIFYLQKKSSAYLMVFLRFNLLFQAAFLVELICLYRASSGSNDISMAMVIPFQILQSIPIYIKCKWVNGSIFYFCSLTYLFVRMEVTINFQGNCWVTVFLIFFSSWVIKTLISYDQEKKNKEFYKNMVDSYDQVNYFKLIMKNVIPSSIFIIDYANSVLKFTNNFGNNLINSKDSKDLLNSFKNFEFFVQRLKVLSESNESSTPKNAPQEELSIILKRFYSDKTKKPIKATFSKSEADPKENNFLIINVWTSPPSLSETEKTMDNECLTEQDSKKIYYELKVVKVYWEDSICLLLVLNDNTNAFRISELINLNTYKNQLLASVSHDLRTPLNGLTGMLELSLEKTENMTVRSYLELAKKSAAFLNYLVHDILDFSLINFKKLRLNIEQVNVKLIIEEMLSLIEFQAAEKHIELIFDSKCEEVLPIFSDITRIKQILLNLLSNALKFTSKGFVKVILATEAFFDRLLYKISVQDTGIGIKQEDLGKLYRLFGRLEDQENINKTGIGLGLTISKKISKLLCPEKPEGLDVESVYGLGSTFSFCLASIETEHTINEARFNLDKVGEEHYLFDKQIDEEVMSPFHYRFIEECERLNTEISSNSNRNRRKILVADDDLMNLMIAEQYLKIFNWGSIRAINGKEAYELVKQDIKSQRNEICLVLMDCNMPVMDGFQASLKIQSFCRKMKREKMPILAVTANATAADLILCKSSGIDYFLEKPMKRNELKKMIGTILNETVSEQDGGG